jgi:hypothetical protein
LLEAIASRDIPERWPRRGRSTSEDRPVPQEAVVVERDAVLVMFKRVADQEAAIGRGFPKWNR